MELGPDLTLIVGTLVSGVFWLASVLG